MTQAETEPAAVDNGPETFRTFTDAPVATIGEPSSDRRILTNGIELAFRNTPLPLQWCKQNSGGHVDSYTVGVIENISRHDNQVVASGYLLNTPEADEAAGLLTHGVTAPSVDIAGAEWHFADASGNKLEADDLAPYVEAGKPLYMAVTKGEIIGVTLVALPAFGSTKLALNNDRESRDAALVASAAAEFRPRVYSHTLFEDPHLTGPTLPTMNEEGRIYGHLAVFGQCHRSIQSECVLVPRSPSGYAHFHTSPGVRLDNGAVLPVGRLTVGTGHADPRLRPAPAAAHYDDTGSCFALVRVGEDDHGIWFSGVAAPGASPEIVEQGLSAPLSGDWRNLGQGLDLIAALAVNTPGFAVQGRDDAEGRPAALVAAVGPSPRQANVGKQVVLTVDDIRDGMVAAMREYFGASPTIPRSDSVVLGTDETPPDDAVEDAADEPVDDAEPPVSPNEQIEQMLTEAGL